MTHFFKRNDTEGGIAVLTLDRPPVNALTPALLNTVAGELGALDADPAVRAVVVASSLPVFSAGVDLKQAQDFSIVEQTAMVDGLNGCFSALYRFSKPLITAVNGAAIAGGLYFVLTADRVLSSGRGRFGLAEVRVGVMFPVGALEIARATLPPAAFRRMLLSGETLDADAAASIGIVDEITAPDDLMSRALDVARDFAMIPQATYAKVKAQMRAPVLDRIDAAIAEKSDPARTAWFADETPAAMAAMIAATRKR